MNEPTTERPLEPLESLESPEPPKPSKPSKSKKDRPDEWKQMRFAFVVWAVIFAFCLIFAPGSPMVRIGISIILAGLTIPFFLVLVPEVTGLVVFNLFTGKLKVFGPGLNFKFPWELVRRNNFFSLALVTRRHEETYAAKDGPLMFVKWSYQYHPDPRRLDVFITLNKTTVERGVRDMISSSLSRVIARMDAEDARRKVRTINEEALLMFQQKLEEEYGINLLLVTVADIDFSADYQEARSARARMGRFVESTKFLKGRVPGISDKEAINTTLLEQGKSTKKTIFEVEGLSDALKAALKIFKRDS